ncbi:MAG TPA: hypothetical protein VK208_13600 [Pyrinomonadaceae bacterium]|nr:hypothetical protein [Pyrinomonadaceae bacterium]
MAIRGIDSIEILEQALEAAETFHPLNERALTVLLAKTADTAATGRFEPFKTMSIFDGTEESPKWAGEEPPEVRHLMPA